MTLETAKILPFRCKKPRKKKMRTHHVIGPEITPPTARLFIRALVLCDIPKIKALIDEHANLATLTGNYFSLPLHIACIHKNIPLIGYLIEKGACIQTALNHPQARHIPLMMKRYLYTISMMKARIMNQIENTQNQENISI